jgi:hypothetical protein
MGFRTRVQTVLQVLRSKSNGTRVLSFSCAIPQNYYIVQMLDDIDLNLEDL